MEGLGSVKARQTELTAIFRELLAQPGILQGPGVFDGISARLVERAGFPFVFMSGFCTSAAWLGAPDTGLISYAEMLDTGRNIREATASIPILADGDTGYGNAMNVKRTVRGYADAGISGIQLEDQAWPKTCGHVGKKKVVPQEEAVARVKAACDARDEGRDILIVARTDARQAEGLEEALWRAQAFADVGADDLIIDALETEEEMRHFCAVAPGTYKMFNVMEGGRSPLLPPEKLEEMGCKLMIYRGQDPTATFMAFLKAPGEGGQESEELKQQLQAINDSLSDQQPYMGGADVNAWDMALAPRLYTARVGCKEIKDDDVWELDAATLDVPAALSMLCSELGANDITPGVNCRGRFCGPLRPQLPTGRLTAAALCQVVAVLRCEACCALVDESLTSGDAYWEASKGCPPFSHLTLTGGAIGCGPPLALGAAIARPSSTVIYLQAREGALPQGFGVPSFRATSCEELAQHLSEALAQPGTHAYRGNAVM